MMYDHRNLAYTVHGRKPQFETTRCTVVRQQKPPYSHQTTDYHEWSDRAGGLKGGTCIHCHKQLTEVRVRIKPPTSRLAKAIANTLADVPPIRFISKEAS
jgi:hypothetical protein